MPDLPRRRSVADHVEAINHAPTMRPGYYLLSGAGADDILIPMDLSRELHALIPGAEFAVSKGGYAFLWEFPQPFNEAVLNFVGKHRR